MIDSFVIVCSHKPKKEENEWFYDEAKETLYLIPNATTAGELSASNITAYRDGVSGAPRESYVAVVLETLISINGTKEVQGPQHHFGDRISRLSRPCAAPSRAVRHELLGGHLSMGC